MLQRRVRPQSRHFTKSQRICRASKSYHYPIWQHNQIPYDNIIKNCDTQTLTNLVTSNDVKSCFFQAIAIFFKFNGFDSYYTWCRTMEMSGNGSSFVYQLKLWASHRRILSMGHFPFICEYDDQENVFKWLGLTIIADIKYSNMMILRKLRLKFE